MSDATHLQAWGGDPAEYFRIKKLKTPINPLRAFAAQKDCARRRGISWQFSLWKWWSVWQQSGRWHERGVNGYVMCRKGDVGPYSVENVFIATARENNSNTRHKNSGLPMGVKKPKDRKETFHAYRRLHGRKVYLGKFLTAAEAHAAYRKALGQQI